MIVQTWLSAHCCPRYATLDQPRIDYTVYFCVVELYYKLVLGAICGLVGPCCLEFSLKMCNLGI